MPGIMSNTMHEAMMMNAWSPDWYHWFRFSTAIQPPLINLLNLQQMLDVERLTGIAAGMLVGTIERGRGSDP